MHRNAVNPTQHSAGHAVRSSAVASATSGVDLHLDWIGVLGGTSCPLETAWRDPSLTQGIAGVYLIWSSRGGQSTILYVGSGRDIGAMLQAQHHDPRIAAQAWSGDLNISWAAVASVYRPGVTQYLVSTLSPQIAEAIPVARAVSVNLPI